MRWIITGGAGFIGKNLVIRLLLENQNVIVVDKIPLKESGFGEDIERFRITKGHLRYSERNLTKPQDLDFSDWFSPKGGDVLVHLAAMSGVKDCSEMPLSAFYINLEATFSLLDGAADFKAKRFVCASSGAVVAGASLRPSEIGIPQPVNVYGAMKSAAEQLCRGFCHERGLSTAAMRFSNVYGPYSQHKNSAANKFVRDALAGKVLQVHGDGTQRRDFVFVADVVDAIIAAGKREHAGPEIFHVSSGIETAILDDEVKKSLYDEICEAIGDGEKPFDLIDEDPGVKSASLNCYVSRRVLRIGNPTPLSIGLKTTVEWYKRQNSPEHTPRDEE